MENDRRPWLRASLLLGLGVVLFALGAKLGLIHFFGTDQPYADQWATEGLGLVRGPLYYKLGWNSFSGTHGEHRPALTLLWAAGLITANGGQWDCFVELVANLAIYGTFLLVAWRLARQAAEGLWLAVAALFMAGLFALPGNYENFLWGFQSGFLFLLLTGTLHVAGTLGATRPGWIWAGAQLAGLAGLFSIAAGMMSAAALVVLATVELVRGRRDAWAWATFAANALLLAFGLWLLPAAAARTDSWFSLVAGAVVRTGYMLSWPQQGFWWCLLLQAPWLAVAVAWGSGGAGHAGDRVVATLGLWAALAVLAIAYGREVTPETIGVRYFDVLFLGVLANALALVRLIGRRPGWSRRVWAGWGLVWLITLGTGLWHFNKPERLQPVLDYQKALAVEQTQVLREFLLSQNPAGLQEFARRSARFPHYQLTLEMLHDKKVYPYLPPSIAPGGPAGPLSRLAPRAAALWPVFLVAGLGLLVAGGIRQCFPVRPSRNEI